VRTEKCADREAVRAHAKISTVRQQLKPADNDAEPEKRDPYPTKPLPSSHHPDAGRDKRSADEQPSDELGPPRAK